MFEEMICLEKAMLEEHTSSSDEEEGRGESVRTAAPAVAYGAWRSAHCLGNELVVTHEVLIPLVGQTK